MPTSAATHARSFEPGAWFVSPTARRTRWRGARAELDLRRCSSSRGPSSLLCSGWCRAARSCLPFGFQAIKQRQTSCPLEDQLAQAELPPGECALRPKPSHPPLSNRLSSDRSAAMMLCAAIHHATCPTPAAIASTTPPPPLDRKKGFYTRTQQI